MWSAGRSSSPPRLLAGLGCGYWVLREAACPWETEGCHPGSRSWIWACDRWVDPYEPPGPGPGPDALCLCEGEGEGQSPVCPCGPCWALGLWAAAEVDPGFLHLSEMDGQNADEDLLRRGGPVWVDLCPVCLNSVCGGDLRSLALLLLLRNWSPCEAGWEDFLVAESWSESLTLCQTHPAAMLESRPLPVCCHVRWSFLVLQ